MNKAFIPFSPFSKSLNPNALPLVRSKDSNFSTREQLPSASYRSKIVSLGLGEFPLNHTVNNLGFIVTKPKSIQTLSPSKDAGLITADETPQSSARKSKKTRRSFDSMVEDCEAVLLSEGDVLKLTPSDILRLTTGNKDDALALQIFAENCTPQASEHLVSCLSQYLGEVSGHPTGNFVVQKLIRSNPNFAEKVSAYCRADFSRLSTNEFSSRVMQCLIETNSSFRKFALAHFREDLETYTQTFAAAFLVSVAVRCADNDEERDLLSSTLAIAPKRWLARKYFKRVLVAYISVCSEPALDRLFGMMSSSMTAYDFFRDRYSCLVLLACIERGLVQAQKAVFEVLLGRSFDLFRWSVFKYFLEHLLEKPILERFRFKIHINLRSLHPTAMKAISANLRVFSNYNIALDLTMRKINSRRG